MNNTDNEKLVKLAKASKEAYKELLEIYQCLDEEQQRAWDLGEVAGILKAGGLMRYENDKT